MIKSASLIWRVFFCGVLSIVGGCIYNENTTSLTQRSVVVKERSHIDFSKKPMAATEQFTETERRTLINKLTGDAQHVKTFSRETVTNSSISIKMKNDAYHHAEKILQQIEKNRNE
ncbi:hypothetical protein [Bartonella sp. CB189]|uniref:hypothetical protein n=1 Tax=Bartonella sp. CB189 TaxID=3112254 RepID=UPI002F961BD1